MYLWIFHCLLGIGCGMTGWLALAPESTGTGPGTDRSTIQMQAEGMADIDLLSKLAEERGIRIGFLMYIDRFWQPWTARIDGKERRQAARLPVDGKRLSVSENGEKMLVNGVDGSLYLVDGKDATHTAIEVSPEGSTDASISPEGDKIAFSVNTVNSIDANDIWIAPSGGGKADKLTTQQNLQHYPVWNGPYIYYLSGNGVDNHDIWRVHVETGEMEPVVTNHGFNFEPSVSRTGEVVFSSNKQGTYDIWALENDSEDTTRLTSGKGYEGQPAVSPDGLFLLYLRKGNGNNSIWLHERATGKEFQIPLEGKVRCPVWIAK